LRLNDRVAGNHHARHTPVVAAARRGDCLIDRLHGFHLERSALHEGGHHFLHFADGFDVSRFLKPGVALEVAWVKNQVLGVAADD
jgi:aminopeptidase-like protein